METRTPTGQDFCRVVLSESQASCKLQLVQGCKSPVQTMHAKQGEGEAKEGRLRMQHCPEEGILTSFGCCPFLSRQARIVFLPGVSLSAAKRFFTRRMMGREQMPNHSGTQLPRTHTQSLPSSRLLLQAAPSIKLSQHALQVIGTRLTWRNKCFLDTSTQPLD